MDYWLVKSEPNEYSWDDLIKNKEEVWDGIRNYQARNNLKGMKKGDLVLFYHSGKTKEIVGVAEVAREAYPDPADKKNEGWVVVNLKPSKTLNHPISLAQIKSDPALNSLPLIKQSRLSVMPVEKAAFDHIIKHSA